jgi:hypothetical protein
MEHPMIPPLLTPASEAVQALATTCVHQGGVEAIHFDQLPISLRMDLRTRAPDLSPTGGPFNASDVGVGPRTRFIAGLHYKDRYVVVYEHGGRGYHVDLLTYVAEAADDAYSGPLARQVVFVRPDCAALDAAITAPLPQTPYVGPYW